LGLRELAVTLIAGLGLYLLSLAWRWLTLRRQMKSEARSAHRSESIEPTAALTPDAPSGRRDMPAGQEPVDGDAAVDWSAAPARDRAPAEPGTSSFGFDALLEMQQTHRVVDVLRAEQVRLQEEVALLRAEVAELNAALSSESRTASHASPQYEEAVGLARRGIDVQAIAERCGISVAEAELVRALAGTQHSHE
jgi:hypothetical protein